jgi:small-conductance mechanosensitive channel
MVTNLIDLVEKLKEAARGFFSPSGYNTSSYALWALLLFAMLILPIGSMVIRPFLRLAAAVFHSGSAIIGAIIVCISSWCILVIHYLTASTRLLAPTPTFARVILGIVLACGLSALVPRLSALYSPLVISALGVIALLGIAVLLVRRSPQMHNSLYRNYRSQPLLIPCVCLALLVLVAVISHYFSSNGDLHRCLAHGVIDHSCLKELKAKPL